VKSVKDIQEICKEYDWLHNNLIRRTIVRIIDGKLKRLTINPVEWLKITRNMVSIEKLILQEDSRYYRVINIAIASQFLVLTRNNLNHRFAWIL
ncbi:MAG: hypothetical protein LBF00_03160, partial [Mycoplasmataceae bacterium]|nr:hypothetical protein [Mycoplasmataceae bacterium]